MGIAGEKRRERTVSVGIERFPVGNVGLIRRENRALVGLTGENGPAMALIVGAEWFPRVRDGLSAP